MESKGEKVKFITFEFDGRGPGRTFTARCHAPVFPLVVQADGYKS